MATVVRVKRRRHEDVADILLLSCKKSRLDGHCKDVDQIQQSESLTGVLKFAGTVSSKASGISNPVKVAIRKEKLEREYKQHQLNILGEIRQQTRHHQRQSSQKNRFTVTAKHRAPHLERLDQLDSPNREPSLSPLSKERHTESRLHDNTNTEPSLNGADGHATDTGNVLSKDCPCQHSCSQTCNTCIEPCDTVTTNETIAQTCGKPESGNVSQNAMVEDVRDGGDATDGMYCLVDMEAATTPTYQSLINASEITCNAVPMVRERVAVDPDDYVYDLYYTNSRDFDFRLLENVLTLEAYGERLVHDGEMADDDAAVAGYDDDDSNDEGNWRNDYPDCDPGYLDNCDAEYSYGEDMADRVGFEEDAGQLADWMSWRCNVDKELSSDDDIQQCEGARETTLGDFLPLAGDDQNSEKNCHSDTND